ncbi:MAG: uncharacterized protein JWM16_5774 [Verrucomicrobiales bacterium]|nr:uncharacterized protein [Verrucomicrobiales bacterium]
MVGVIASNTLTAGSAVSVKKRYEIKALPQARHTDTFSPRRINVKGQVLGLSFGHVVLYSEGKLEDLHLLLPLELQSTGYSMPLDLNNHGDVLFLFGGHGSDRFFLVHNGALIDLSAATSPDFRFVGMNDVGGLVGSTMLNGRQAFSYTEGQIWILGSQSGYFNTVATALNNTGTIVGWANYGVLNNSTAVVFESDEALRLGGFYDFPKRVNDAGEILSSNYLRRPNGDVTYLTGAGLKGSGFNNHGVVVGASTASFQGRDQAVIYDHGILTYLNDTVEPLHGWFLNDAVDINDNGEIIGFGFLQEKFRAFLLSPHK